MPGGYYDPTVMFQSACRTAVSRTPDELFTPQPSPGCLISIVKIPVEFEASIAIYMLYVGQKENPPPVNPRSGKHMAALRQFERRALPLPENVAFVMMCDLSISIPVPNTEVWYRVVYSGPSKDPTMQEGFTGFKKEIDEDGYGVNEVVTDDSC